MVNGKWFSRYFNTKAEADAQRRMWETEVGRALTPLQVSEALRCYGMLNGKGLTEAVEFYLKYGAVPEDAPLVRDAEKLYLDNLIELGRTQDYARSTKFRLAGFIKVFGDSVPSGVTTARVRDWILSVRENKKVGIVTKMAWVHGARTFMAWCRREGWIKELPIFDTRLLPRVELPEPEIYSAADIRAFFAMLEEHYPQAIPHYAVRAFFGLRTAEANRLSWDDVDLDAGILRVRATKAKTKVARTLDKDLVPETGFKWLRAYFDGGKASFVVDKMFQNRIYRAFVGAKKNGFRKSFATMFTSLTKNQQTTMMATGHTVLRTLQIHYEACKQPKEEAQAYFAVLPKKDA